MHGHLGLRHSHTDTRMIFYLRCARLLSNIERDVGFIMAKDGPLPVGGHAWRVWVADPGGNKQEGRTLTVTLQ